MTSRVRPAFVVQRLQHGHRRHRRAVGVGDDARRGDGLRVDLADDQRHVRIHPPRGGVVDDDRACRGEPRGLSSRCRCAGREQRDVEPRRVREGSILDRYFVVTPRQRPTDRPLRGKEPHLRDRERALDEHAAHDAADLPGRADDADAQTVHRPVPPCTVAG